MKQFRGKFIDTAGELGVSVSAEQADKCVLYAELLLDWNQRINLTRITDPQEMAIKHFADSASVLRYDLVEMNARLIDVGTGAGFPGLVLKILRPDLDVVLLDSVGKRLNFLQEVIKRLGLDGIELVHARAEDGGHRAELREACDVAVARAVADLRVLGEYLLPFVKVGGKMVAWKGPDVQEEMEAAQAAFRKLGAKESHIISFALPEESGGRSIVWAEKVKPTPRTYPRKAGDPARQPLG